MKKINYPGTWLSIIAPALLYMLSLLVFKNCIMHISSCPPAISAALSAVLLFPVLVFFFFKEGLKAGEFLKKPADCIKWLAAVLLLAFLNSFIKSQHSEPAFIFFLAAAFLGPVSEELLYRGIILERSLNFYGPGAAVIISSLLFAAAHPGMPEFFMALLAGLLLGWMRISFKSLCPAILAHIIWNILSFI